LRGARFAVLGSSRSLDALESTTAVVLLLPSKRALFHAVLRRAAGELEAALSNLALPRAYPSTGCG